MKTLIALTLSVVMANNVSANTNCDSTLIVVTNTQAITGAMIDDCLNGNDFLCIVAAQKLDGSYGDDLGTLLECAKNGHRFKNQDYLEQFNEELIPFGHKIQRLEKKMKHQKPRGENILR